MRKLAVLITFTGLSLASEVGPLDMFDVSYVRGLEQTCKVNKESDECKLWVNLVSNCLDPAKRKSFYGTCEGNAKCLGFLKKMCDAYGHYVALGSIEEAKKRCEEKKDIDACSALHTLKVGCRGALEPLVKYCRSNHKNRSEYQVCVERTKYMCQAWQYLNE